MATPTPRVLLFDAATGITSERPLTDGELALIEATAAEALTEAQRQRPLDPVGALATLLVVVGALNVVDAANAVQSSPEDLVAEAQAWAIAGQP